MTAFIWRQMPAIATLARAIQNHARPLNLIVCHTELSLPSLRLPENPSPQEQALHAALQAQITTLASHGTHLIEHLQPNVHFWWLDQHAAHHLHEHFSQPHWQTPPLHQQPEPVDKPWLMPPPTQPVEKVLIIGAGIAGAATARALAEKNIPVILLEALPQAAQAASGNHQGLLYAKISPHFTEQTELLLSGYGFSRRLLERIPPESDAWQASGVLHLNHNSAEHKRNGALAQHTHHHHLYRAVSAAEASNLAGIPIHQDGLFWPQGAWLNPAAWIRALLTHPLIQLHTHTVLHAAHHNGQHWIACCGQQTFSGSHIVFCSGADSHNLDLLKALPFQHIRGQTSLIAANTYSQQLRCALSGASYFAPASQQHHCYGATFLPHDNQADWRLTDEQHNRQALAQLHPELAAALHHHFDSSPHGHAAVRCDAPDHLPLVGELSDFEAMRHLYAPLALDKNYPINSACPYLPNAYLNTAHGSRGLSTAPLCAASFAASIAGSPNPLSRRLRHALHPNRVIIRAIIRGHF